MAKGPTKTPPQPPPAQTDRPSGQKRGRLGKLAPERGVAALALSLVLLLVLYTVALLIMRPASPGQEMTLDTLIRMAGEGKIQSAQLLDQDARVTGTFTDDAGASTFWTSYPRGGAATNDLLRTLLANGTEVRVEPQNGKAALRYLTQFVLPFLIVADVVALGSIFVRTSCIRGQLAGLNELGERKLSTGTGSTTFASLAGVEKAVAEVAEVRDYLARPESFRAMGALPPKGTLLVGPPGCGKTLLARALAAEAGASFFPIAGSEFVESQVGVGAARMRDLFRQARAAAPAIVFIDELDAVGRQRGAGLGGGHDEREQVLNELLVQMDGFSPTDGVAVLAATNRSDILDPALLRSGRFDRHITIDRPDRNGRLEILRLHARRKRLADPENDLPLIALQTPGFTGADLVSVLNEGALLAVRKGANGIDQAHLYEAVERVRRGPRSGVLSISAEDQHRVALHEAGHAVVAAGLGRASLIHRISMISHGPGVCSFVMPADDHLLATRHDLRSQIAVSMAGIAAEEVVLGEPSIAGEADLERATSTARDMAGRFGMSDRLGRVRVLPEGKEVFLGRDYLVTPEVAQPTLEHLDADVRFIISDQEDVARAIIRGHLQLVEALAAALVRDETVQGAELERALSVVVPHRSSAGIVDANRAYVAPGAAGEHR
jgi:cell division protease FtsH